MFIHPNKNFLLKKHFPITPLAITALLTTVGVPYYLNATGPERLLKREGCLPPPEYIQQHGLTCPSVNDVTTRKFDKKG